MEWLAAAQAWLWDLDLAAHRQRELRENPVGCGRGMIRRADKYLAQQHGKEPPRASGPVSAPPVLPDRTAMPDDYLSAWEPLEFEYDSEETDPREIEDGPEEDDASVSSDSTYKSNGHNTDRTRRTNTSNHNLRCNQRKWKDHRFRHPLNAKKEEDRHKGKVVLSLFRDSQKEGTLTYTDWRQEVEEYLRKGYDDNRVKDAMLSSVEGQAYVNFRSCDEGKTVLPRRSWERWTVFIMSPWPSGTWMRRCAASSREWMNPSSRITSGWRTLVSNWSSTMETICLYVRVLRDSDIVLEQDRKVPDYCWNASICKDICKARTRVLPGTFSVDLLSDTEFLVYKGIRPKRMNIAVGLRWND